MRDLYSDDYESVAAGGDGPADPRRLPQAFRRGGLSRPGRRARPLVLPARHPRRRRGADHQGDGGAGAGRAGGPGRPRRRRTRGSRSTPCSPARPAPMPREMPPARPAAGGAAGRGRAAGRARHRRAGDPRRAGARRGRGPADAGAGGHRARSRPRRRRADVLGEAVAAPGRGARRGRRRPAAAQPAGEPAAGRRPRRRRRRPRRRPPAPKPAEAAKPAGDQGRLGGAGARRSRACGRGRGWSSSAPSTARRSPARPGRSWWPSTRDLLVVEEPLRRAHDRQRAGLLPAAGGGLRELGGDAADVRGAARARRRLHPGDAAVDGAPAPSSSAAAGRSSTPAERRFFAEAAPWGFILFARNVADPGQLRRLTGALRDERRARRAGADRPGGRPGGAAARRRTGASGRRRSRSAQRLPEAGLRARAMYLRYRLIAGELRAVGIDVNCAPVLDVARAGDACR